MENILQELFAICEDKRPRNQDLSEALNEFYESKEHLIASLEGKNLATLLSLTEASTKVAGLIEKVYFIYGVKVGAKLIFEILA